MRRAAALAAVALGGLLVFIALRTRRSTGWRRMTDAEVTPELGDMAQQILREHHGDPYGTVVPFWDDEYAGLVEEHYHEPGGPVRPWGFHPGVSLLRRV